MKRLVSLLLFALVCSGGIPAAAESGENGIYALSWNGVAVTSVSLTHNAAWPVSSPSERRIAFVSTRDGDEAVWVMNADGSGQRRVTQRLPDGVSEIGSPTWSPDGTKIAFTANFYTGQGPPYRHQRVYVVPTSGGSPSLVDDDTWGPPVFSSDSKLIAYGVYRTGIGVAHADGSGAHEFQKGSVDPKWAPRGRRILTLRGGSHRVTVMDTSGRLRWTLRAFVATVASWTGDGRVVFVAGGTSRPGLYVTRPGSQRAQRIVDVAEGGSLALSADSRYAAVVASGSTYLVRLSGSSFRRLGDEAGLLAWSSDDQQLAFLTDVPSLSVEDIHGVGFEFGFDSDAEFFGFTWNGARLIVASAGVNWPNP
jgi:Tol biopolymer transport system component